MTQMTPDIEQMVLEDMEPEIECDIDGCSNTATWMFIKKCCPDSSPICDGCKEMLQTMFSARRGVMFCRKCGLRPLPLEMLGWERI